MRIGLNLCAAIGLLAFGATASAGDKPTLELKIVAKKDSYTLDTGGKTPKEFKEMLEDIAAKMKKRERAPQPPRPAAIDLVIEVKNTSKADVALTVEGDSNVVTLDVKGPSVIDIKPQLAFTADFRIGKTIKLEPGKTYEIPVKALSDGFRGASRWIYWTEPGEYTIGATYQLGTADGGKGTLLKAEPIKVKVEEKK